MILLDALPDRPYAVLGLGRSGRAAAKALVDSNRAVWAWDDNESVRAAAAAEGLPIVDPATRDLSGLAALILSPGIPHTFPEPHPVVARAPPASRSSATSNCCSAPSPEPPSSA